jgi:hypothetical protein
VSNAHYWTHLSNLSNEHQFEVIADFFETVSEKTATNEIHMMTMAELVEAK